LVLKEKKITYTIKELLTTEELWEEGKAMHHCVASYSNYCSNGTSAIYSMTSQTDEGVMERMVTIEVKVANKQISQIRKVCNAKPNSEDMRIISGWIRKNNLHKSAYLS